MPDTFPPNLEHLKSHQCTSYNPSSKTVLFHLKTAVSIAVLQANTALFKPLHLRALDHSRVSPSCQEHSRGSPFPAMLQIWLPPLVLLQTTAQAQALACQAVFSTFSALTV